MRSTIKSINFSTIHQFKYSPGLQGMPHMATNGCQWSNILTFSKDLESTQVPSGSNVHNFGNEALVTEQHQRTLISNIKTFKVC